MKIDGTPVNNSYSSTVETKANECCKATNKVDSNSTKMNCDTYVKENDTDKSKTIVLDPSKMVFKSASLFERYPNGRYVRVLSIEEKLKEDALGSDAKLLESVKNRLVKQAEKLGNSNSIYSDIKTSHMLKANHYLINTLDMFI